MCPIVKQAVSDEAGFVKKIAKSPADRAMYPVSSHVGYVGPRFVKKIAIPRDF
jgi:hypothetical protein